MRHAWNIQQEVSPFLNNVPKTTSDTDKRISFTNDMVLRSLLAFIDPKLSMAIYDHWFNDMTSKDLNPLEIKDEMRALGSQQESTQEVTAMLLGHMINSLQFNARKYENLTTHPRTPIQMFEDFREEVLKKNDISYFPDTALRLFYAAHAMYNFKGKARHNFLNYAARGEMNDAQHRKFSEDSNKFFSSIQNGKNVNKIDAQALQWVQLFFATNMYERTGLAFTMIMENVDVPGPTLDEHALSPEVPAEDVPVVKCTTVAESRKEFTQEREHALFEAYYTRLGYRPYSVFVSISEKSIIQAFAEYAHLRPTMYAWNVAALVYAMYNLPYGVKGTSSHAYDQVLVAKDVHRMREQFGILPAELARMREFKRNNECLDATAWTTLLQYARYNTEFAKHYVAFVEKEVSPVERVLQLSDKKSILEINAPVAVVLHTILSQANWRALWMRMVARENPVHERVNNILSKYHDACCNSVHMHADMFSLFFR